MFWSSSYINPMLLVILSDEFEYYLTVTWSVPQPENIPIVFAFDVSHPEPTMISVKFSLRLNIYPISVTLLVSKLLTSTLLKLLQKRNILFISVTLLVSKPLTSTLLNSLQSSNMYLILVTLLVPKPLTSTLLKLLHHKNI